MTRISMIAAALTVGMLASIASVRAADSSSSTKEEVTSTVQGFTTVWRIYRPVITQKEKNYTKITFEQGDTVTIEAGGADQTGGHGKTWKRYVDPQGPNADRLYHGLIEIPGITNAFKASPTGPKDLVRFLDMGLKNISTGQFRGTFVVGDLSKVATKDRYLRLGFEDDNYSDNGYWGRDNGTGDQCVNLGTSYVVITITHKRIFPLKGAVGTKATATKAAAKATAATGTN